jgi:hypothetical protein
MCCEIPWTWGFLQRPSAAIPVSQDRSTGHSRLVEARCFFADVCVWARAEGSPFAGFGPPGSPSESLSGATLGVMPSKHPRIAVTVDPELGDALERVRVATGTQEADATLVRRLAVEGARAELDARRGRRAAAEALLAAMDRGAFELDLDAIDRLNEPADSPP